MIRYAFSKASNELNHLNGSFGTFFENNLISSKLFPAGMCINIRTVRKKSYARERYII